MPKYLESALKFTYRDKTGSLIRRRGISQSKNRKGVSKNRAESLPIPIANKDFSEGDIQSFLVQESPCDIANPPVETPYIDKRRNVSNKWDSVRSHLIEELTSQQYPATFVCVYCDNDIEIRDIHRCSDCGPRAYFCEGHIMKHHEITLYHNLERFNPDKKYFEPVKKKNDYSGVPIHTHSCDSLVKTLYVAVIDLNGHHCQKIEVCDCEDVTRTFVRNGLWPATPLKPKVAFPLKLMKTFRMFTLETKMSLHGFCSSLDKLNYAHKMVDLKNSLKWESVLNFCYIYNSFTSLQTISTIPDQSACPVCPKEGDIEKRHCIAMDACFGEVRRKAAGNSHRQLLHQDKYFLPQKEVDDFLDMQDGLANVSTPQGCVKLQAGSVIRSKNKTEKLDIKGIFGSVCYHDYPDKFINLKHGERMAYPEFLLQKCQESKFVLYDIGCKFETFLKNKNVNHNFKLGIPIFHVYGHKMRCQILYSPRSLPGMGLYDGEGTERLWSYLRPFCNITKEMTPENRQDLLVESFMHYGSNLSRTIAVKLKNRLHKGFMLKESSEKEFQTLTETLNGISIAEVQKWIAIEERQSRNPTRIIDSDDWQEDYALKLRTYYEKISNQEDGDQIQGDTHMSEMTRLNVSLTKIERKRKIQRWSENDPNYLQKLERACKNTRIVKLKDVREEAIQYHFFGNLRKRYSDGQKISNRISKCQMQASKKLNEAISRYNAVPTLGDPHPPFQIKREIVTSLDADIWLYLEECPATANAIPPLLQRKIVDGSIIVV